MKNPALALKALWGTSLSTQFRQRLMLTVTAVNGCRYCTYLHTREALHAGLTSEEIETLLGGVIKNVPTDEIKAILYAQYWADNDAKPDSGTRADLIATYGIENSRLIEMALLLIRIGNLCGNTFDYFLFRLSFGKWGIAE